MPHTGTPLSAPPLTGKERWQRSAERERILQELHALALDGTLRSNAPLPTPEEFEAWAKDLRRGRLSIPGGFIRWLELLRKRHHPRARWLAVRVHELIGELIDLDLPTSPFPAAPQRMAQLAPAAESAVQEPVLPIAPAVMHEHVHEDAIEFPQRRRVHVLRPTIAAKAVGQ